MRKNFTKEAQKFRAEGEEKALEVRSTADRERVEILAQAQKESETLRGEGDGTAAKIYADAFSKDPGFFEFYRSMQAYRKACGQLVGGPGNLVKQVADFKELGVAVRTELDGQWTERAELELELTMVELEAAAESSDQG